MNILWLDDCPDRAAGFHSDQHKSVMIKEGCQILNSAARLCGLPTWEGVYNPNGRFARWAAAHPDNRGWLLRLVYQLNRRHVRESGGPHASFVKMTKNIHLRDSEGRPWFGDPAGHTEPARAFGRIPDEDVIRLMAVPDPVEAYREFYRLRERLYGPMTWGDWRPVWMCV